MSYYRDMMMPRRRRPNRPLWAWVAAVTICAVLFLSKHCV